MPQDTVQPEQVIQYNKTFTLNSTDNSITIQFDVPEGKELVIQVKIWGDYRDEQTQ